MSGLHSSSGSDRGVCDCCSPGRQGTPVEVTNTPGQPVLARRVGTAGTFAEAMTEQLDRKPALQHFTERRLDDPTTALVDAWSVVLDVLTFYTERLANEGYLRTAQDPRSLHELAHSVGYAPDRGRASATTLAFTLEDAVGAPALVDIPVGTKVASLPGPGDTPQTYETTATVTARPAWNAIAARSRDLPAFGPGATSAYVEGARADLAVGDAVLLVGSEREGAAESEAWAFRLLSSVTPVPALAATRLSWSDPLGNPPASSGRVTEKVPDARDARLFVLRRRTSVFGAAAPDHRLISSTVGGGATGHSSVSAGQPARVAQPARVGRALVGVGVEERARLPLDAAPSPDWPGWSVRTPGQPEGTVDLDSTYPAVTTGSWAVLSMARTTCSYRVLAASDVSRTDYTLNAKVARLSLSGPPVSTRFGASVRETSVWVASELLPLTGPPEVLPVQGNLIELRAPVPTLEADRAVVVTGPHPWLRVAEGVRTLDLLTPGQASVRLHPGESLEVQGPVTRNDDGTLTWVSTRGTVTGGPADLETVTPPATASLHSEVAHVATPAPATPEVDRLLLAGPLTGCYDRTAVRVLGNVAPATHGETTTQTLGSGDAAVPFQQFPLAQHPLTYLVSPSDGAVVSTLQVRVGGRLWREVPRLYGTGPAAEVYTTSTDDEGRVTVQFGDGRSGSRLPTGTNNVSATYRVGTGPSGQVGAGRLTMVMTRPLGVRSASNPLPTGVASDPEGPSGLRSNVPRTALTLERVVSLRDVQDFARSVPGIGKAQASWLWDGRRRFVHVTVAGSDGQQLDGSAIADLTAALTASGDPRLPLTVAAAEQVLVNVVARVVVDPAYEPATVLAEVDGSIRRALAAEARELGQALTTGDIILAAHAIPGVVAVTIGEPQDDVPSLGARMDGPVARPAQLVSLAPSGLTVGEVGS